MFLLAYLKAFIGSLYRYLFFTRNCFFQVSYILLVGLIHACVIYDGLRVVLMVDPNTNPLFWPFILVTINMLTFMVSCLSNPGVLSQHGNGASLLQHSLSVYPYDGVIFEPGVTCTTCNIIKPARSKHCSVTNRCVFKFDHYCVWISNVVGGLNHRYFVALLISLTAMCAHGAAATLNVFSAIVVVRNLWAFTYLDASGVIQPMNYSMLIRTLAFRYRRLTVCFMSLVLLSVIVGLFACYHLVLALLNQTTNERYKYHYAQKASCEKSSDKASGDNDAVTCQPPPKPIKNVYDRGLWQNLMEELFPLRNLAAVCNKKEN